MIMKPMTLCHPIVLNSLNLKSYCFVKTELSLNNSFDRIINFLKY